jgi:hypothetical protein
MTVAPGVLASTAANTRTEAGRTSAPAVLRATTMSREIYCGKILPRDLQVRRRVGRSQRGAVAEGSARPYGACEYPRREPRGPIAEKRRLHLASCDEALFIITTSPLDSPTASARPLPSSCRAATRGTYRDLGHPAPHAGVVRQGRALLQAVRRRQPKNLRRTGHCLARQRAVGNEGMKNRSVIANLTLRGTREPFRAPGQACGPRV